MIHEGDAYLREREMERLPAAVLPSRLKIEVVAPEERICERLTDCETRGKGKAPTRSGGIIGSPSARLLGRLNSATG